LLDLVPDPRQLLRETGGQTRWGGVRLIEGGFLVLPSHGSQALKMAEIGKAGSHLRRGYSLRPSGPVAVVLQNQLVEQTAEDL
jgi:hypothetical protein